MKPIAVAPDHDIYEDGTVVRRHDGMVKKPTVGANGYLVVSFRRKTYLLHRLLAEAFIPNPVGLSWVLHNDSNKLNNSLSNLRWGTPQDNANDRVLCYHASRGYKFSRSNLVTLNPEQKSQARTLFAGGGWSCRDLASYFNVTPYVIDRVISGLKRKVQSTEMNSVSSRK